MARPENPPFGRGETFYGQSPLVAIDPNNLGGTQMVGKEWVFEDVDYSFSTVGARPNRTNRYVTCRLCRNTSGIALLPKRLASFQKGGTDGRWFGDHVDGYTTITGGRAGGVIDEWLPAAGVAANDVFWLVVAGPTRVLTDLAGGANNVVNVGDELMALTAATSQATTAGRIAPIDLTGATAVLGENILHMVGNALSAVTTANTNADLLIELKRWF